MRHTNSSVLTSETASYFYSKKIKPTLHLASLSHKLLILSWHPCSWNYPLLTSLVVFVRVQCLERILPTEAHPNAEWLARGCREPRGRREGVQHVQTSRQHRRLARRAGWKVPARRQDRAAVCLPDRTADEGRPRWRQVNQRGSSRHWGEAESDTDAVFPRFWWEAEGVFAQHQRAALLNGSLSRIICDNTDIDELLPDSFVFRKYPSGYTSCDYLPSVNLEAWKEEESQGGLEKGHPGHTDKPVKHLICSLPDLNSCGSPGMIENGDFILASTSGKLVAYYSCYHGFQLTGAAAIVCEGAQWRDQPPQCERKWVVLPQMSSATPLCPARQLHAALPAWGASVCVRAPSNTRRAAVVCAKLYCCLLALTQKLKCLNRGSVRSGVWIVSHSSVSWFQNQHVSLLVLFFFRHQSCLQTAGC